MRGLNSWGSLRVSAAIEQLVVKTEQNKTVAVQIEHNNEILKQSLFDAIRGLQFGDINSQNLEYTAMTLMSVENWLNEMEGVDVKNTVASLHSKLDEIRTWRNGRSNPVSASSMTAGDVDLF